MLEEALWKLLRWKKASIVFLLCGMLRHNEKAAIKSNREQFDIVADHLQNWIDPIRALIKRYPLEKWGMVGYTFGELFADLMLVVFSIAGGAYFNAARTMRSIFESMVPASYIAENYPWYPGLVYDTMKQGVSEEKFDQYVKNRLKHEFSLPEEEQERITGFKYAMIGQVRFLTEDEKSGLFELYSQLSKLVHPTPLKLRKHTEDAFLGVTFFYDRDLFNQCAKFMDGTMDLVLAVLITSFPQIVSDLKSQKYVFQSLTRLPLSSRLLR